MKLTASACRARSRDVEGLRLGQPDDAARPADVIGAVEQARNGAGWGAEPGADQDDRDLGRWIAAPGQP